MAKKPRINTGKKRKPMTLAHRKAIGRGLARVKGDTTDYDPYEKKGRKPGKASGKASGGASTNKRAKAAKRRTNGPKAVESVAAKKLPKNYVSGGGKQADPDFLNKDAIRNEPGYQDFLDMQREMVKASPEARAAFMNQVKQARKAAQIDHGPDPENGEYGRNRAAQRRALHLEAMAEDMGLIKAENTRRAQDQADAIDDRAEEAKKRNDQRRKQGMKDRKAARDRAEKQRAEREKRDQEAQRAAEREARKATAAEREADREAARRAERDKQEQALERAASEKAAARRAEYANWDDDQLAEAHAAIMDKWDGDLDPANDENYDYSIIGQRERDRKTTADLLDEMDDRAAERAGYSDNRDYNTIAEKSQGHSAAELGAAEQEYFDQIAGDRQAETELRDYLDQARQAHAARQAEYKAELDKLTPPEKGDRSDEAKAYRALKRKHDEARRLSNGAKKKHAALETRMRETYPDYDRPFYHTDHEELTELRDALDSVQDRDADTEQLLEQVQDELRYRHPDELDGWADLSIRDMTNLVKKYGHDLTETQIIDRMAMNGNDRERVMRESVAFQEAYGDWLRDIMAEYAKGWTHKGVVDEDPETFLHDLMYSNKNDGTNITAEQMLSNPMYARRASGEARRLFASLGFLPSRANFMRTLQGRAPKDYSEDRLSEITRKGGNATRRSKTRILLDDEISAAADARGLRGRARSQFMKEERQRRAQQNVENLRAQDEERRRNQAADKPADNPAQATANTVTTEDGREIDMSTIPGAGKDTDKGMTDRVKAILAKQAAQRAESDTPESTAEKTARENGTTPNTENVTKAVAKAEADKPAKRGRPKLNGPTLGEQRAEATREQTDRINELKANRPATGDPARAQWEYDMATARIQHAEAVERFERDRMASLAAQNKPLTSVKKNIDKAQAAQNKAREERDNALAKARKEHGDDAAETIRTTGGYVAPPKKKRTRKNNADTTGNNTETRAAKGTPKRDTWANRRANYTEKERAQLAELKDNRPSKKAKNRPQWEQDYAEAKRDLLARQVRFEEERRDELKRGGKSTKQAEKNLERLTGELKQAEVTAAEKKAKNAHKKWTAYPSFNKPDPDVHPDKAPREWKQWEVDRDEHRLEQEKLHLASEEALEDYSRKRGDERPYNADHARKELEEVRQRLEKNRRELEALNNAENAPAPANTSGKPTDAELADSKERLSRALGAVAGKPVNLSTVEQHRKALDAMKDHADLLERAGQDTTRHRKGIAKAEPQIERLEKQRDELNDHLDKAMTGGNDVEKPTLVGYERTGLNSARPIIERPTAPSPEVKRDRTDNTVTFKKLDVPESERIHGVDLSEWTVTGTDLNVGDIVTAKNNRGREQHVTITQIVSDDNGKQTARFEKTKPEDMPKDETADMSGNNGLQGTGATVGNPVKINPAEIKDGETLSDDGQKITLPNGYIIERDTKREHGIVFGIGYRVITPRGEKGNLQLDKSLDDMREAAKRREKADAKANTDAQGRRLRAPKAQNHKRAQKAMPDGWTENNNVYTAPDGATVKHQSRDSDPVTMEDGTKRVSRHAAEVYTITRPDGETFTLETIYPHAAFYVAQSDLGHEDVDMLGDRNLAVAGVVARTPLMSRESKQPGSSYIDIEGYRLIPDSFGHTWSAQDPNLDQIGAPYMTLNAARKTIARAYEKEHGMKLGTSGIGEDVDAQREQLANAARRQMAAVKKVGGQNLNEDNIDDFQEAANALRDYGNLLKKAGHKDEAKGPLESADYMQGHIDTMRRALENMADVIAQQRAAINAVAAYLATDEGKAAYRKDFQKLKSSGFDPEYATQNAHIGAFKNAVGKTGHNEELFSTGDLQDANFGSRDWIRSTDPEKIAEKLRAYNGLTGNTEEPAAPETETPTTPEGIVKAVAAQLVTPEGKRKFQDRYDSALNGAGGWASEADYQPGDPEYADDMRSLRQNALNDAMLDMTEGLGVDPEALFMDSELTPRMWARAKDPDKLARNMMKRLNAQNVEYLRGKLESQAQATPAAYTIDPDNPQPREGRTALHFDDLPSGNTGSATDKARKIARKHAESLSDENLIDAYQQARADYNNAGDGRNAGVRNAYVKELQNRRLYEPHVTGDGAPKQPQTTPLTWGNGMERYSGAWTHPDKRTDKDRAAIETFADDYVNALVRQGENRDDAKRNVQQQIDRTDQRLRDGWNPLSETRNQGREQAAPKQRETLAERKNRETAERQERQNRQDAQNTYRQTVEAPYVANNGQTFTESEDVNLTREIDGMDGTRGERIKQYLDERGLWLNNDDGVPFKVEKTRELKRETKLSGKDADGNTHHVKTDEIRLQFATVRKPTGGDNADTMNGQNGLQAPTPNAPTTGETRDRTDNVVTFRRINGDEWGVTGTDLQVGDVVTARNRKGREKPVTITEIVTDTDGKQVARFEDNRGRKRAPKRDAEQAGNNAETPTRTAQAQPATPPTLPEGHDPYTGKPAVTGRAPENEKEQRKLDNYLNGKWSDFSERLADQRELKRMGLDTRDKRDRERDAARAAYKPTAAEKKWDSAGLYFNDMGAWQTSGYKVDSTRLLQPGETSDEEHLFTIGRQEVYIPVGGMKRQVNGKVVVNGTDMKTGKPVTTKSDEHGRFGKPLITRYRPTKFKAAFTPQNYHAKNDLDRKYPNRPNAGMTPEAAREAIKRQIAERRINADPAMSTAPTITEREVDEQVAQRVAHEDTARNRTVIHVIDNANESRTHAGGRLAHYIVGSGDSYYTAQPEFLKRSFFDPDVALSDLNAKLVDNPEARIHINRDGDLRLAKVDKIESFNYGYRLTGTDEKGDKFTEKVSRDRNELDVWLPLTHQNGQPYTRTEAEEYAALQGRREAAANANVSLVPEQIVWGDNERRAADAALDELRKRGGELNFDDADEVDGLPDTPAPAPQGKRHKKGTPFTTENLKEGETLDERGNIVRGDFKIISTGDGYRYMETGGNERMSKNFTSKSLDKMRKDVDALTARNPKPAAPSIDNVYRQWPDLKFQTDGNLRLMLEGEDDPERAAAIRAVLAARGGLA